jgi:hypothetical protein
MLMLLLSMMIMIIVANVFDFVDVAIVIVDAVEFVDTGFVYKDDVDVIDIVDVKAVAGGGIGISVAVRFGVMVVMKIFV